MGTAHRPLRRGFQEWFSTAKETVRLELRTLNPEIRSFFMRVRKIRFLLTVNDGLELGTEKKQTQVTDSRLCSRPR